MNWPRWRPLVTAAVVVIAGAACSDDAEQPTDAASGEPAGVGDTLDDGQFAYTLDAFECGRDLTVPDADLLAPQGQWCRADLTVQNTGTTADTWIKDEEAARLYDTDYAEYPLDRDASLRGASVEGGDLDFTLFNPLDVYESTSGSLWWDLPLGAEPAGLLLSPDDKLADGTGELRPAAGYERGDYSTAFFDLTED